MVLWDASPPSSPSAGFVDKVAIPGPSNSSLDYWPVCSKQYELGLSNEMRTNAMIYVKSRCRNGVCLRV